MALPLAAKAAALPREDLLDRALRAMGGRAKLARVKALRWTGQAQVMLRDKRLELEIDTRVEPFVRARSRSWLAGKPDTARTLIIEPAGGFVERSGERKPLPARQTLHERQQYGLYGYMLLALAPTQVEGGRLTAQHPGLPPVRFELEGDYLAVADYTVASPDSDAVIAQRFLFEGEQPDQGVHWPHTITILQNDKPYFILDIESFSVEFA
ncbi:hypothetical protein AB2M62_10055 [Sphingomonas sp. MMS12-HWE2-04]|uniref:hypothetical protein n=1 Tax=Sphingomonas sp. MMS12-HWE2-04 TaxID=3234199 RepID=UPI00384B64F2